MADTDFWNAMVNTFAMFVIATVPQLVLAMVLAQLLNSRLRGATLWRMGILLPNVTSVAAVGIIFTMMFSRDFGLFNWLLGHVGVDPIAWQDHRWSSWLAISTMVDWRWTGYNALILLAALQSVPTEIYEAARIDGANAWRTFWSITVPMLRPTLIFVVGRRDDRRDPAVHRAAAVQPRRQLHRRRDDRAVPDRGDVPHPAGVHRPAVRLRRDGRLGAVPVHRGVLGGQRAAAAPDPIGRVRTP